MIFSSVAAMGFYSLQNATALRDCGKDKTFFAFALRSLKMVDYPAHDERLQIKKQGALK